MTHKNYEIQRTGSLKLKYILHIGEGCGPLKVRLNIQQEAKTKKINKHTQKR